jgi:hypothetical protein
MGKYEVVEDQGGLGTIYVGGKGSGATQAKKEILYDRKISFVGKQVKLEGDYILIRSCDGHDVSFIDVTRDCKLDLSEAVPRRYQLVLRGTVPSTVTIPAEVQLSSYLDGSPHEIQIHKDQIVVLTLIETDQGDWSGIVSGETENVVLGVQLVKDGPVYVPDDDGKISLPVDELLATLEESLKKHAEDQALYWN